MLDCSFLVAFVLIRVTSNGLVGFAVRPHSLASESRDQLHSRGTFARQIFGSASLERKRFEDTTKGFFPSKSLRSHSSVKVSLGESECMLRYTRYLLVLQ